MRVARAAVLFAFSFVSMAAANAQSTLGELLDMGGAKVVGGKFTELVPLTMSGRTTNGNADFVMTINADGSFKGTSTSRRGYGTSDNTGNWRIDENGRFCVDEYFSAWNLQQTVCGYFFKLGEKYFRSESDTDRKSPIAIRTVNRASS